MIYPNARDFKNLMQGISKIEQEAVLNFSKEGIKVEMPDRAVVVCVVLKIPSEEFELYDLEKDYNIGLSVENLVSLLKNADKKDKLLIETEDTRVKLTLVGKLSRSFYLPMLDISIEDHPDLNALTFKATAEIKTEDLIQAIKEAHSVSEALTFETDGNTLKLFTTNDIEEQNYSITLPANLAGEKSKAKYPLQYLEKIANKISENVKLSFATDYPAKFEYRLGNSELSYYIAPQVEE